MVISCSVSWCKAKFGDSVNGEKIKFHRYPISRPDLLQRWMVAIGRTKLPSPYCYVCSKHFPQSSYIVGTNGRLKVNAVPMSEPNGESQEQETENTGKSSVSDQISNEAITCVVLGCPNYQAKDINMAFHKFPLNKPDLIAKWLTGIRRPNYKPGPNSYVCDEHFVSVDYDTKLSVKVLRHDAVPRLVDTKSMKRKLLSETETDNTDMETGEDEDVENPSGTRPIKIEKLDDDDENGIPAETNLNDILSGKTNETLQLLIVGENGEITNSEYLFKEEQNVEAIKTESPVQSPEKNSSTFSTPTASQNISYIDSSRQSLLPNYQRPTAYYEDAINKLRQKLIVARKKVKVLQVKCRRLQGREAELKSLLKLLVLKRGKGEKNIDQLFEEYKNNITEEEM